MASNQDAPTWEEFLAATYLEPFDRGVFIVNGDEAVDNEKKLREIYYALYGSGALAVHHSGGADARWSDTQKRNLTYCVSDEFGDHKQAVIDAIAEATERGWELFADVDFVHMASQDPYCGPKNQDVLFDVRPVEGAPYNGRAFFPWQGRQTRNVLIDAKVWTNGISLSGLFGHELGHVLGFRHEHTRPEAGQCYEDSQWRGLTEYDSSSIMHYPDCGLTGPQLTFSSLDAEGAAALYGPPRTGDQGEGTPPAGPEPSTGTDSRSVAEGETINYQAIDVAPGSVFEVSITGTGDADLYVAFDRDPTTASFDCRPYLNGSNESCSLDVPAGAKKAHIMIHGYTAADYELSVTWFGIE